MCTFANRIKNLRKENNMTQSDLGKLLGVGNTTLYQCMKVVVVPQMMRLN